MSDSPDKYSYGFAAYKALLSFLTVLIPGEAALLPVPNDLKDFQSQAVLIGLAIAMAALRVLTNALKNPHLEGSPVQVLNPPAQNG